MQDSPLDTRQFRRTMGLFATGVAVLATLRQDNGEAIGMTANAITSVSLDPMLVLVCVDKKARIAPHLLQAEGFSLSFLGADQEALSVYFAGLWQGDEPPPFTFQMWAGQPLLTGCIGAVACRRYAIYEGGDHWIVLGEVIALHHTAEAADPLIFFSGRYRRLAEA